MPEYIPGYYLPGECRPVRFTAEDVQRIGTEAITALRKGALKAPAPDPCCAHATQLDQAVHALARAHGRPEAAERIARGLPVTTTKARPQQAGLTHAPEEPLAVEDLTPHLKRLADHAARFASVYLAGEHGEQCCGCINRAQGFSLDDHHPRPHAWTGTRPQERCTGCGGARYWTGLNDTQESS